MHPRKPRLPFANAWFFPAAALYAAVLLPISVLGLLGLLPALPGLVTPAGHAREMLFGFALAVIAGYLLGPQPLRLILSLLGCWLLARVGALFWPGSWLTMGATLLFAAGLAWKVLPRFVGAAKKWRNQSVAPVVGGLALLSAVTATGLDYGVLRLLQHEALLLLAALLFFMGGRIIAPALAGHAQNEGRRLDARVQPQLEGAVLILLALALLLAPLPWLLLQRLAAAMLVAASVLSGIRLLRWQPWHCRTRPDLLVAAGHAAAGRPAAARPARPAPVAGRRGAVLAAGPGPVVATPVGGGRAIPGVRPDPAGDGADRSVAR